MAREATRSDLLLQKRVTQGWKSASQLEAEAGKVQTKETTYREADGFKRSAGERPNRIPGQLGRGR